ncbi:MAG: hypothetical protein CVU03_07850 [Bacteroidetes bacterium HGW-Bacteroidetes-2]|jgi:hypothetical protein|nr:MAG: hypothetical protein CVU03_07850 [Bacteroidetes bacterium HGW-Bacteroidetes-2]
MRTIKILTIALCVSLSGYAQDPLLFETDWFLMELTVDGELIPIPNNGEIDEVTLNFINVDGFYTVPCNSYNIETIDFSSTSFTIISSVVFDDNCGLPSTQLFEGIYTDGFFLLSTNNQPFDYVLESGANNTQMLTITNIEGDVAIYGNAALGLGENPLKAVILYPNPAQDFLHIENGSNSLTSISLYTISGRVVFKTSSNLQQIDLSLFPAGLYFITLEDDRGGKVTKKVVKN